MTGTLRDRLAAVLGPGNDDTTAFAQADAVLEVLAHETQARGWCGAPAPRWSGRAPICDLPAGHSGMHEAMPPVIPYGAKVISKMRWSA